MSSTKRLLKRLGVKDTRYYVDTSLTFMEFELRRWWLGIHFLPPRDSFSIEEEKILMFIFRDSYLFLRYYPFLKAKVLQFPYIEVLHVTNGLITPEKRRLLFDAELRTAELPIYNSTCPNGPLKFSIKGGA